MAPKPPSPSGMKETIASIGSPAQETLPRTATGSAGGAPRTTCTVSPSESSTASIRMADMSPPMSTSSLAPIPMSTIVSIERIATTFVGAGVDVLDREPTRRVGLAAPRVDAPACATATSTPRACTPSASNTSPVTVAPTRSASLTSSTWPAAGTSTSSAGLEAHSAERATSVTLPGDTPSSSKRPSPSHSVLAVGGALPNTVARAPPSGSTATSAPPTGWPSGVDDEARDPRGRSELQVQGRTLGPGEGEAGSPRRFRIPRRWRGASSRPR